MSHPFPNSRTQLVDPATGYITAPWQRILAQISIPDPATVIFTSDMHGAYASDKIANAVASLPAEGGIVVADFSTDQVWAGMVTISKANVTLLLPPVIFACSVGALKAGEAMIRIVANGVRVLGGSSGRQDTTAALQAGTILRCASTGLTATSDLVQIGDSSGSTFNAIEVGGLILDFANTSANSGRYGLSCSALNGSFLHDIDIWNAGSDGFHAVTIGSNGHSYDVRMANVRVRAVGGDGLSWTTAGASCDFDRWTLTNVSYHAYNPLDGVTRFGTNGFHLSTPAGSAASQSIADFEFTNCWVNGVISNAANAGFKIDQAGSGFIAHITWRGGEIEDVQAGNAGTGFKISSASPSLVQQLDIFASGFSGFATPHNISLSTATAWVVRETQPQVLWSDGLQTKDATLPGAATSNPNGGIVFKASAGGAYVLYIRSDGILVLARTDVGPAELLRFDPQNKHFYPAADNDIDLGQSFTRWKSVRGLLGVFDTSLQVGGGTPLTKVSVYTPALTPAAVAANTTAEQTFAVAGLTLATDKILAVNKPTAQAGLGIVGYRVAADNTLAITFSNNTAGAITPTAGETYKVVALSS